MYLTPCHHLTAPAIEIQHVAGLRHCYILDCFYHYPGDRPVEPFSDMGDVTSLASSVCLSDGILSFKQGSLFCWRFSRYDGLGIWKNATQSIVIILILLQITNGFGELKCHLYSCFIHIHAVGMFLGCSSSQTCLCPYAITFRLVFEV